MGLVTASVELDHIGSLLNSSNVLGIDLLDKVLSPNVVLVDVLLVMFLVVDLQDLADQDRLEGVVRVWKLWQGDWAELLLHLYDY